MENLGNRNVLETKDFVLTDRISATELYADGFSQLLVGFPVTKIILHSVIDAKTPTHKEVRRTVTTLSIPTTALIQLAQMILSACKNSEGQLAQLSGDAAKQLKGILAQIPPGKLPEGVIVESSKP